MAKITLYESATPGSAPPAGTVYLYPKTDGRWYFMADDGIELPMRSAGAGTGDLMADGSVPLTANWNVGAFDITADQFHSAIASGTAPFTVASTTLVTNLNAELHGGKTLATVESDYAAAITAAVAGLYDHKGAYDASTNTPDLDTAPSGILKGDAYTVSVAGTFFAVALEAGDVLIADQDNPVDAGDWTIVNRNIDSSAFATAAQGATADSAMQDLVDDNTPQLGGALDGQGNDLNNLGVAFLTEQAAAEVDVAGKGQVWVKDTTPNELWFTDDAGTDHGPLSAGGTLNNFAATTDPGVGDDNLDGYSIGSWWLNITDQRLFHCENASTGAAVWLPVYGLASVRVVAGTTDTILSTDSGKIIVFTNAAAIAVTLPNTFALNFQFTVIQTTAAGIPTVTRSGADTINGASAGIAPSAQWKGAYFVQHAANAWICLK